MRLVVLLAALVLASSASAQTPDDPKMRGCSYPDSSPDKDAALQIMPLTLPYLDNQKLVYRNGGDSRNGYAVRRSLRIYFYNADGRLLGTAVRRSQDQTSYYGPDGKYIGRCLRHKLAPPPPRPQLFDPRVDPN